MTRGATSGSIFRSPATGERIGAALPSQLGDAGMSATPCDPSPLRRFASRDPLSRASDRPLGSSRGSSNPQCSKEARLAHSFEGAPHVNPIPQMKAPARKETTRYGRLLFRIKTYTNSQKQVVVQN